MLYRLFFFRRYYNSMQPFWNENSMYLPNPKNVKNSFLNFKRMKRNYDTTTRCRYKLLRAKFQFYILKQQQNTCSLENVHSNAELILKKYNLYNLKNIRKKNFPMLPIAYCYWSMLHWVREHTRQKFTKGGTGQDV